VIVYGKVQTRYHNGKNRLFKVQVNLNVGDVIGADWLDNGKTTNVESWNVCMSDVELIQMEKSKFD
jgi:hypothetical protein